jgi:WD40 repeat protein
VIRNPFPGPQPYRASDRARFYGREDMAHKLGGSILATRCVTVHGPSGAGKSSLVQAAVLPALIEAHDVRVVRVDGWPEGESPLRWLALALFSELRLGEIPADLPPSDAVLAAARRSARGSSRLVIVYLDQIEQLFYSGRSLEETEPFFACLQDLVELPLRTVRVVLSLREDYLGRFRDRLRDRGRMLDNGFRVGPLTVAELTSAVCQAAAAGEPSQTWSTGPMRPLMLQVRLPGQAAGDEAEAQSAYAQIVCRALFQQRAQGEAKEGVAPEAEPILRGYLETTLSDLGAMRAAAQRLLEDHLVTADGSRTLRTEKELLRIVPAADLLPILKALEGAAILHAEEHQGSRYFEIGHDWLARKVFEQRQEREAQEEQRRRDEEQQRELERQKQEAAERLAKARRQRRTLGIIAAASIVFALVTSVLGYKARKAQQAAEKAEQAAHRAHVEAVRKRVEADDQRILAGYLALASRGESAFAMKLLPEVRFPAERLGWLSYASDALGSNALRVTLRGHTGPLTAAVFSADGKRVLTASEDGTARVWHADGTGRPVELTGHTEAITSASFSPDGQRVLTTSEDGTARLWSADGKGDPVVLKGGSGRLLCGAFSPDGKRVIVAGDDSIARLYDAGGGSAIELKGHTGPINAVVFFADGARVATASDDRTARVWTLGSKDPPLVLRDHQGAVQSLALSADGSRLVTTSHETTARVFAIEGKTARPLPPLKAHDGEVVHAAISPDGKLVATACGDRLARIFAIDAKDQPPIVLEGATSGVTHVAFRPDGKFLATASLDATARVYPAGGGSRPLVLSGHGAAIGSIAWSPDGSLLITAAADARSADHSAKIWNAGALQSLRRTARAADTFHGAAFSADGALLVATYDDHSARLQRSDGEGDPIVFKGHEGWVAGAALSAKGDRVVTAAFDKTARVWSADGKGEPVVLKGHTGDVHSAAFSPDGTRVVTASEDRTARVWSADGKGEPVKLEGHQDWVASAAFSADGRRVVTASYDHTARVWSADGKGEPVVLEGHRGAVYFAAFDATGQRVVTASEDGTARVWSAGGGVDPVVLRGRGTGTMLLAVLSADGKHVAGASDDGLIHVWSADGTGQPIVLQAARPAVAIAFVDKDQGLLAVLADNTTHHWTIDVEGLRAQLAAAHADCLPVDVRTQYLDETMPCALNALELCESGYQRRPAPARLPECNGDVDLSLLEGAPAAAQAAAASGAGDIHVLRWIKDFGPEGRHVKVVVLPGDADVTIAGAPAPRRDGAIELVGKKGDVYKLRVSKAGKYLEQDVTLQDGAASPALIDLSSKIAGAGPGEKKPLKPGAGNFDALMPKDDD